MPRRTGKPTPRGRGEHFPGARDAILVAAREQFADFGFELTTIRSVARAAGVDPKLVMHFYASKDALFEAALTIPEDAFESLAQAFRAPPEQVAESLIRAYVRLWEDPATATQIRASVRSASTSDRAAEQLRSSLEQIIPRLAGPNIPAPALAAAMTQLLGAATARYIIKIPTLADLSLDEFVATLVPSVQASLHPWLHTPPSASSATSARAE